VTDHHAREPVPGVPRDDTTTGVLRALADAGFDAQFLPGERPGTLHCRSCGSDAEAASFEVVEERRLEGASDPDDMVLVVAVRCPVCAAPGSLVLGYGPDASPEDADVVAALQRRAG
jgi:hypothetical protein